MKNSLWLTLVIVTVILMLAFLVFFGNKSPSPEPIPAGSKTEQTNGKPSNTTPPK